MEINGISRIQEISPDISSDALKAFDCEDPALNAWLCSRDFQNEKHGSLTYVAQTQEGLIAGYFCLNNTVIPSDFLSAAQRINKPDPIPCCLLDRLAVDRNFKGKGLGGALLVEAVKITRARAEMSGCRALVVQPKSESDSSFYEHFGFRQCKSGEVPLLFFEIENIEFHNDEDKSKPMITNGRKELQSMIDKITSETIHERMDFGIPIGKELL